MEAAGIPTVVVMVRAFLARVAPMRVPRALIAPHIMGRPLGAPHDAARQRAVLEAALALLAEAPGNGTLREFPEPYRAGPGAP